MEFRDGAWSDTHVLNNQQHRHELNQQSRDLCPVRTRESCRYLNGGHPGKHLHLTNTGYNNSADPHKGRAGTLITRWRIARAVHDWTEKKTALIPLVNPFSTGHCDYHDKAEPPRR